MRMHVLQNLIGGMRTGNRQHARMRVADNISLCPKTTGNNNLAILGQCLANRVQRFFNGGIDKAAGIDDHQIGTFIRRRNQVTLGTQSGKDLF